jgi:hypothetical protein
MRKHALAFSSFNCHLIFSLCLASVILLCCSESSSAYILPDTGQTKCYNNTQEIQCPAPGEPFYGQDAQYQGNLPAFKDNADGTVTDLNTNLMWQKWDYHNNISAQSWQSAIGYCDSLGLEDYHDWRLPRRRELISIVNYGVFLPSIELTSFPDCKTGAFWSYTTWAPLPDERAWTVFFDYGQTGPKLMSDPFYVRCVRGNSVLANTYIDNGDGTVSDATTGLMWQQKDDGLNRTWEEALSYCEGLKIGEYDDWRLPNLRELESILVYSNQPTIDPVFECIGYYYVSSTTVEHLPQYFWSVGFSGSGVYWDLKNDLVHSPGYVRCVRDTESFCASTSDELQTALTKAAKDGRDNVIKIIQGNYIGSFVYDSIEANKLTLKGGYSVGCASRVIDPINTVLDAQHLGRVLYLSSSSTNAAFYIEGITIQNGASVEHGAGLWVETNGPVTLTNSIISKNSATYKGGGIRIYGDTGSAILKNNIVTDNSTDVNGGGIYISIDTGQVILINNVIANNSAKSDGGGLYLHGSPGASDINLTNNTISGNSADLEGGGIYLRLFGDAAKANICNNIIWNNSASIAAHDFRIINDYNGNSVPSVVNLFDNDFDQSAAGFYADILFQIDPSNLNNRDPLFDDPDNGDYHLQLGSPCIDTGNNAAPSLPLTDIAGKTRIMNRVVDMGAYEYPGFTPGRTLPGVLLLLLN